MPDEKLDLESFIEELVSVLDKRLKRNEEAIRQLERELRSLKSAGQGGIRMDSSVLKVLRGK
jgi:hypothetical protein